MTFAQFEQMPDNGDRRYELRNGEPIEMPFPIHRHFAIQHRIRRLLEPMAGDAGEVATEWGFRVGEYDYRIADVAFLSRERWDRIDKYLTGAPELVVEVLSPSNSALSNSASEMLEKQILCLENGCQEFWVVDPRLQTVTVYSSAGLSRTYRAGQQIPLVFGGQLEVNAIFG